ncbi:HPr kinase/phosphorylase [uncultured Rhodospira sp.]|uniref:HPr kinase/phosphorylase n=1 Tax=uncultured Rhodospira sp. TaxID=1936189 RepID=UPI00261304FF|nr:HPr kinase/phosphatase C-terminal domain-containing protein [uncultured Rhodospira sp.]
MDLETAPSTVHATCVALAEGGVLLRGGAGSGKSDLALRLLESGDARLVADDRVILDRDPDTEHVYASTPEPLRGLLEVRGIGVISLDTSRWVANAPLIAVIDMAPLPGAVPRTPSALTCDPVADANRYSPHKGTRVRRFVLWPFEVSAPAKVRLAAAIATEAIVPLTEQDVS